MIITERPGQLQSIYRALDMASSAFGELLELVLRFSHYPETKRVGVKTTK
jgi:hypothetical protein